MLDEEFFKTYPVSVFHGVREKEGIIAARLYNPRVSDKIFLVTEDCLFRCIKRSQNHQRICPQDTRDAMEQAVAVEALEAVQAKKLGLGMPLEAPRLGKTPALTLIEGGLDPSLACEG